MKYIPNTKEEEKQLLQKIGVSNFSDLVDIIPEHLRTKDKLGIGEPLSEMEINKELRILSNNNSLSNDF